ncbi:hypothetical protein [Dechloromonas hortensis]|uniref:hypothetical protein n=1 Tax=Dechloromonas hortensis TaxID=337779 RepID=UPI001B85EED9|nr:hypothetical protein [Dechloromonas hortensis]
MKDHDKVARLTAADTGLYDVYLNDGRVLRVFVCECYSFGGAEYYETTQKLGAVDAVVINSNWCGYSFELKIACQKEKVGVFDISGFMSAINLKRHWEFMTEAERERLKK